ncbi:MAG: toxin-antitoxin system YwqK family antitoxin [Fusobacteriaceae bacterium]
MKKVNMDKLEQKGGIYYEIGSKTSFTGIAKSFYSSGQPEFEETYKNGKLDGPHKSYYESGELRSEGNGLGKYKEYYSNGKLKEEIDENGSYKRYDKSGNLIEKY